MLAALTTCVFQILLVIFPVDTPYPDTSQDRDETQTCPNAVSYWSIKNHALHIETKQERIRIPLPPVTDRTEIWLSYDFLTGRAAMGNWGLTYAIRGPKEPT